MSVTTGSLRSPHGVTLAERAKGRFLSQSARYELLRPLTEVQSGDAVEVREHTEHCQHHDISASRRRAGTGVRKIGEDAACLPHVDKDGADIGVRRSNRGTRWGKRDRIGLLSKRPQVRVLPGVPTKAYGIKENDSSQKGLFSCSSAMCPKCVRASAASA